MQAPTATSSPRLTAAIELGRPRRRRIKGTRRELIAAAEGEPGVRRGDPCRPPVLASPGRLPCRSRSFRISTGALPPGERRPPPVKSLVIDSPRNSRGRRRPAWAASASLRHHRGPAAPGGGGVRRALQLDIDVLAGERQPPEGPGSGSLISEPGVSAAASARIRRHRLPAGFSSAGNTGRRPAPSARGRPARQAVHLGRHRTRRL